MKQIHCGCIKLKEGSLERVQAWAAEIMQRKDEALATMRYESIYIENFFLDQADDGDYLIV